ncbi:hypothetical protein D3C71_1788520 [compost metagenome]
MRELNKRKPRDDASSEATSAAQAVGSAEDAADELHTLRLRVAELTTENIELRRQLAQLQADLPAGTPPF